MCEGLISCAKEHGFCIEMEPGMTFPLIAFTADTVSKLTGLTVRQLQHWDRVGFFTPSLADPERRRPHSRIYSFQDVVSLRTIARLRERGVSFHEMRKVGEFFDANPGADWANRRFFVVGKRVFFTHEDAVLAARPLGQHVDRCVLDLGTVVADVEQRVLSLPVRLEAEIGTITRDRFIMGGVPVLAGTRIPTATVTWFHDNGYSVEAILQEFPRLTASDVQAAIAYEHAVRDEANVEHREAVG
jgi:uncharacterized protein (DUF433 family)